MEAIQNNKYIKLLTDFGIKRIFGHRADKSLLIHFLNNLFAGELIIVDLNHLPTEHFGKSAADRYVIFDLYCELDSGERILIELQSSYQAHFVDRELYYATWPIRDQGQKGIWNYKLNKVIVLGICDFIIDSSDTRYLSKKALMDIETKTLWTDKLLFINLEIPKFNKKWGECGDNFEKWLFYLKNLNLMEKDPNEPQGGIFQSLLELCQINELSDEETMEYRESLINAETMKNFTDYAREEGEYQAKTKMARTMITKGMPLDQIEEITGLNKDELKSLG